MASVALLVGCYQFNAKSIQSLRYSTRDATRVAACLTAYCGVGNEDVVLLLTGAENEALRPTRANVLSMALDVVSLPSASRLDRVWLFLSGHGVVSSKNGRLYFICQDSIPALLEDTAVDVNALIDQLRLGGPSEIVVLLDTCRSVFVQGERSTSRTDYQPFTSNDRFAAVIYSCAPGSASYESEPEQSGIFTAAFLQELGEAGLCTTVGDLQRRLPATVRRISEEAGKPPQVPFFAVEEASGEQIVLVDRPTLYARRRASLFAGETRLGNVPQNAPEDVVKAVVGLDFGTSKTLAAFTRVNGDIYFVPSPSGSPLLESAVTLKKDLSYVVGRWRGGGADGSVTLRDIKRLAGHDDRFKYEGLDLSITDIVTMILSSVQRNIENVLGELPTSVVASYPVNFDTRQIEQLRRALRHVGFSYMRMISEAAAAALALESYYPETDKQALIIDLGGGTLDLAVVNFGSGVVEIKAVDGDRELGGRDFDEIVRSMLNEVIAALHTADAGAEPFPIEPFDPMVERIKFDLNAGRDVTTLLGDRESSDGSVTACTTTLKQAEFARRCAPLLHRFEAAIDRVTTLYPFPDPDWERPPRQIIMLAGQGTRLSLVRRIVDRKFPDIEVFDKLQENAVATGLAVQAGILAGARKRWLLLDVYHRRPGFFCAGVRALEHDSPTGSWRRRETTTIHEVGPPGAELEFVPILRGHTTIPIKNWELYYFRQWS